MRLTEISKHPSIHTYNTHDHICIDIPNRLLAKLAGIRIFVTGGIGGVHRSKNTKTHTDAREHILLI